VKSLKRFDLNLNLNLKGCFEKSLKKKKRKKKKTTYLAYLSARWPSSPLTSSLAAAHGRCLFFFSSCLADVPAPPVSGAPLLLPSFLALLCFAPVSRRRDSRCARPLHFPFLLAEPAN
jgi:hypothetical protein